VGPASVLAHGGGDSNAFCNDECDWVDCHWYRARTAREEDVHVGHGGVVVWYCRRGRRCLCMYGHGESRSAIDKHGLL
jgi:hypothetical protein